MTANPYRTQTQGPSYGGGSGCAWACPGAAPPTKSPSTQVHGSWSWRGISCVLYPLLPLPLSSFQCCASAETRDVHASRKFFGTSSQFLHITIFMSSETTHCLCWYPAIKQKSAFHVAISAGRADYFGNLPNLAARVMALAAPGQVLLEGCPSNPAGYQGTLTMRLWRFCSWASSLSRQALPVSSTVCPDAARLHSPLIACWALSTNAFLSMINVDCMDGLLKSADIG